MSEGRFLQDANAAEIVLGEDGQLALLDASPRKYVERSSAPVLRGRSWTSASLSGGRLYLRNQDQIVCVDLKRH